MISRTNLLVATMLLIFITSCNREEKHSAQQKEGNTNSGQQEEIPAKKDPVVIPPSSPSVKIGNQEWLTTNLNVVTFRNGDTIAEAKTDKEWETAGIKGEPAWCYYLNNACFGDHYGKLYNFFAVDDPRQLAPDGWHVPSDEEWLRMERFLKDNHGDKLKAESGWFNGGNGTNESGFSALPAGMRYTDGEFLDFGNHGFWWTSSSVVLTQAWLRYLTADYGDRIFRIKAPRRASGLSVRCIEDYETK